MHTLLDVESSIGRTFDLRGPDRMTVDELYTLLSRARFEDPKTWSIPLPLIKLYDYLLKTDLLQRRMMEEKPREEGTLGFDYVDIEPDRIQDHAGYYTKCVRARLLWPSRISELTVMHREYRKTDVYDRPLTEGGRKFKNRPFRLIE